MSTIDGSRPGTPEDAVDGIVPRIVVEPADAQAVAQTLAHASREKLSVLTRGAGTKLAWGATPKAIDVLLSTAKLSTVEAHRHGDLTATIQSGATLASVNATLAQHRQWIPLDPPSAPHATIGGIVATNDCGPRRHRYGAPRDLIIGVEFARADGQIAKGGGIVVKNVAGYDLPRLMTGSFGSLAVIVSATFKLYPLTTASTTLVIDLKTLSDVSTLAGKVLGSHLTPTAMEFQTPPLRLLLRFESIPAAVEQQSANAAKLVSESGFASRLVSGPDEEALWADYARFHASSGDSALLKVSALPTELSETLALVERLAGVNHYRAAGRAGLGVFLLRVDGSTDLQRQVITGLREALPLGRGSAVLMQASPELKERVDVWGPIGDGLAMMRAVKQQFDPGTILNRGRGPGNI